MPKPKQPQRPAPPAENPAKGRESTENKPETRPAGGARAPFPAEFVAAGNQLQHPTDTVWSPHQQADFKDRHGFTFADALAIQERQLKALALVLEPSAMKALRKWCAGQNRMGNPADQFPNGIHIVPRGTAIVNQILAHAEFLLDE